MLRISVFVSSHPLCCNFVVPPSSFVLLIPRSSFRREGEPKQKGTARGSNFFKLHSSDFYCEIFTNDRSLQCTYTRHGTVHARMYQKWYKLFCLSWMDLKHFRLSGIHGSVRKREITRFKWIGTLFFFFLLSLSYHVFLMNFEIYAWNIHSLWDSV